MKQFAVLLIVVVYGLFLAACTYVARFGVANRSGEPLEVEYVIAPNAAAPDDPAVAPFKINLVDFDSWNGQTNWRRMLPDEYVYDKESRRFLIRLQPDEAVQIVEEPASGEDRYPNFKIASLRIRGVHGAIEYAGADFYRQFDKSGFNYFVGYR
ncbi:MAG: hypothetical protein JSS81_19160 [Acidobacteria bacterium]|nr:hypothetical protein [Acidobacteriota bacterium]